MITRYDKATGVWYVLIGTRWRRAAPAVCPICGMNYWTGKHPSERKNTCDRPECSKAYLSAAVRKGKTK